MLELILGGAGTGKTHRITELIKKDISEGKRAFLIVPEQETVERERMMAEALPPSSGLTFEVLNFTRLANSFFRRYGGLTYKYVTKPLKALSMWNTLRSLSPLFREYGGRRTDIALSKLMLSQAEEFKAYGVSPEALERASRTAEEGSRTWRKLSDLALIYSAYTMSLVSYGAGDASDDIGKMARATKGRGFFKDTKIYIDSFTSFTGAEEEVIYSMLKESGCVTLALCLCEDKSVLGFESVMRTKNRMERLAERADTEVNITRLSENHRTSDRALLTLAGDLWRFDASFAEEKYEGESVQLVKCSNVYEEAEAVCREIKKLVMGGMRYRDIAVLARNADSYRGIIDNAFEKTGIPYFMSEREDITSMPLAKLLLSALRIKNRGFMGEDVIAYMKTGLAHENIRECDILEQYIRSWSINGNVFRGDDFTMDPYSYSSEPDETGLKVLDIVNRTRRAVIEPLCELFDDIDSAESNKDICRCVFEYMERLSIADKLRSFAADSGRRGDKDGAERTLRLYNSVLDALSVIAEFDCGEERYSTEEFEEALRIILSETSLGNIPTSCDEVNIGSASLFRAVSPRCVILMGMNEGVFPAKAEDSRVLTDEEKELLAENGIELSGGKEEKASEELFYAYRAVCAPSEKLIMSYVTSDIRGSKEQLAPSLAIERTKLLLCADVLDYSALSLSEKLYDKCSAFEYFNLSSGGAREALQKYFDGNEEYAERLERLYIPITDRACKVSPELAREIFGDKMTFSPSALEKYVKCHFGYWCEYVLRLRADEKNIFRLSDTGSLIHALLEKFIKAVTDQNGFNASLAEEEGDEIIRELMRLYIEENFPERDAAREQTAHIADKLTHLTGLLAKNITKELKKSRFVPKFFELSINEAKPGAARPMSFTLSDASSVSVKGIVDRVDTLHDGDDIYIKVVDYKTGGKSFSEEDIKKGLNMQMLLYLFSICSSEDNKSLFGCRGGKLLPAGVQYLSSKIPSITERSGADVKDIESRAEDKLTRSGIVLSDEKILAALNSDLDFKYILSDGVREKDRERMLRSGEELEELKKLTGDLLCEKCSELREGNADISPLEHEGTLPCSYCRMKPICRSVHIDMREEAET